MCSPVNSDPAFRQRPARSVPPDAMNDPAARRHYKLSHDVCRRTGKHTCVGLENAPLGIQQSNAPRVRDAVDRLMRTGHALTGLHGLRTGPYYRCRVATSESLLNSPVPLARASIEHAVTATIFTLAYCTNRESRPPSTSRHPRVQEYNHTTLRDT